MLMTLARRPSQSRSEATSEMAGRSGPAGVRCPTGILLRMTGRDLKADLHHYLQGAREELLWKLDGLTEDDVRRPRTPTGTNLRGLVKHSATFELEYFGPVFGRPHGVPLLWMAAGAELNADMWATADQSRDEIVALYRRAWQHADKTINVLPLDAPGRVPWW